MVFFKNKYYGHVVTNNIMWNTLLDWAYIHVLNTRSSMFNTYSEFRVVNGFCRLVCPD
jgi:hypothetical protein